MATKSVLGKGLASLLPGGVPREAITAGPPPSNFPKPPIKTPKTINTPPTPPEVGTGALNSERIPGITLASLDKIEVNPYQPRRQFAVDGLNDLAASIKTSGVLQPLLVRKHGKGFQLIAGERRFRAAKQAGIKQVPIVIRQSTDKEALELALIENIQRRDLNCIEESQGYQQLIDDFNLTQEEIAKQVGKDRATVANMLRLLKLPGQIIEDLKTGTLSLGHGKVLLSLDDRSKRLKVRNEIIEKKMSVRQTEERVNDIKRGEMTGNAAVEPGTKGSSILTPTQSRLKTLSRDLTRTWGTRVELTGSERRGKIVLKYTSRQELDRLLSAMQNESIWSKT